MRTRWTAVCLLLLSAGLVRGQGPDLQFELCVKQFDQFKDRFNGKNEVPQDTLNAPPPPDRTTLLWTLMGKSLDKATAAAFIGSVVEADPPCLLMLDHQPWFAHVNCQVSDTTHAYPIQFWLVQEKVGLATKWSILSTDIRPDDGSPKPFIHSRNHETGFTDLLKVDLLAEYGVAPYVGPPGISNLFAMQQGLMGGVWTIDEVTEVRMHLLQIPGWFIEVEYRPPPKEEGWITSGWNIIDLKPMSDVEKIMYIWRRVLEL